MSSPLTRRSPRPCVFGTIDDRWGEAVTAAVVLRRGTDANTAELTAFVRERKGSVQTPEQIYVVDELPRTALGKIDSKALRKRC